MIRRILVPALLLAIAACTLDQPAPSTTPAALPDSAPAPVSAPELPPAPPPAPETPPEPSQVLSASEAAAEPPVAPLPPAPAYLVWTADSSHAPVTAWIDGAGREIARRRGLYVAEGARLWRWSQQRRPVRGLDCDCYRKNPDGDTGECVITRHLEKADLVQVGGRGRRPVAILPDSETAMGGDPGKQHPYPTAGAGPYLFSEYTYEGDGCGQHGWWGTVRQLSDVRRDSVMRTDSVRYTLADSAAAMDTLVATDWGSRDGVQGMDMRGVEGEFLSDSALTVYLRFGTNAPFAFGDEGGTYGGRTERVIARRAPPWLAPYVSTPPPVRRYWRAHPRREHAGWSPVDAAHASALLARFRSG